MKFYHHLSLHFHLNLCIALYLYCQLDSYLFWDSVQNKLLEKQSICDMCHYTSATWRHTSILETKSGTKYQAGPRAMFYIIRDTNHGSDSHEHFASVYAVIKSMPAVPINKWRIMYTSFLFFKLLESKSPNLRASCVAGTLRCVYHILDSILNA